MAAQELTVTTELSPLQVAEAFWGLGNDDQADFFAHLDRISGHLLCLQMAWVVHEIADRADRGDYSAMNGFQTMLAHAQGYAEGAARYRATAAEVSLSRMADAAKATQP